MEVHAVPSNPSYPEGGDYGNRGPNMSYASTSNDPRGDYYSSPARDQNYLPHERELVMSHGSCSHCQTHCCQRPTDYHNQPTGSRGERLERYVGTIRNESPPVPTESTQDVRPRSSIPQGQDVPIPTVPSNNSVDIPPRNEGEVSAQNYPPPNLPTKSRSEHQQPVERATHSQDTGRSCLHAGPSYNNDSCRYQTVNVPVACSSQMETPFRAEERNNEPRAAPVAEPCSSQPIVTHSEPTISAPLPGPTQSIPVSGSQTAIHDSVASLMVPPKPSPSGNFFAEGVNQSFSPTCLTHLNFKEKQLAMSAVKKAATNMSCVNMFQDKDKQNCGTIGKRDFQMIMDRIGVLRGMSSREVDAVFKGFGTQTDTEIDYKKFSAACRHAVDNDSRLARMAQK
ncbi:uncharacterized protein [Halyomorpha halys]|uniref:uncharacterized protein n=1 Tax=Halyomorpha halys TaxID=286706 RepID=UPI0006D4EE20|nr:uncharacterized protein LOC106686773 isoform X2 [Halyomorpha halys]